jgi:hypothetical protein
MGEGGEGGGDKRLFDNGSLATLCFSFLGFGPCSLPPNDTSRTQATKSLEEGRKVPKIICPITRPLVEHIRPESDETYVNFTYQLPSLDPPFNPPPRPGEM